MTRKKAASQAYVLMIRIEAGSQAYVLLMHRIS